MTHSILTVEAYETEVGRIVQDVLATMTQYPAAPSAEPYSPQPGRATCAIHFVGDWSGALLIECPLPMAFEFTARLMRIPKPIQFDDDVYDALGELANMIGGNLKSVLPKGATLSMPTVFDGPNYSIRLRGVLREKRMTFEGPDGRFWVTLAETSSGPAR